MLYSPDHYQSTDEDWIDYIETVETDGDSLAMSPNEPEFEDDEPDWDEEIPF